MSAEPVALLHPLAAGVAELSVVLDRMPVAGWDGLEDSLLRSLAADLMRVESRVRAHQAAVTRAIDESGLARRSGASSTGALLAADFGGDRSQGDRLLRTGQAMQAAPVVEEALAGGVITERAARTIADATKDLDIDEALKRRCQQQLVEDAGRLTAKDLERRAMRITDVYQPTEVADADENTALEKREARAWAKASFRMWDNHDGTHTGQFTVPEAQADLLRSVIESIAAPRRDHLNPTPNDYSPGDFIPNRETVGPSRLGRGFAHLCDHLCADKLLNAGPSMVVRLDYTTLVDRAAPATLSTGTRISASEARLTACNAGIIPAVLAGPSRILDFGREKRLFTPTQKLALAERDQGCTFPGCDRPPPWCEAHHWKKPWAGGGTTNLADGVLLCAHHHRTVHTQHWRIKMTSTKGRTRAEYQPPNGTSWQHNTRLTT